MWPQVRPCKMFHTIHKSITIDKFYRDHYYQQTLWWRRIRKTSIWADDYYSGGVLFEQTMKLDQTGTNFGDDGTV